MSVYQEERMLKLGDILLIGPYTYKVVRVLGKWATFEFTNKEGITLQISLKVRQSPALQRSA